MNKEIKATANILMRYIATGITAGVTTNNLVVRVSHFDNGGKPVEHDRFRHYLGLAAAFHLGLFTGLEDKVVNFTAKRYTTLTVVVNLDTQQPFDNEYYTARSITYLGDSYSHVYDVKGYEQVTMVGLKVDQQYQVQYTPAKGIVVVDNSAGYWAENQELTDELYT